MFSQIKIKKGSRMTSKTCLINILNLVSSLAFVLWVIVSTSFLFVWPYFTIPSSWSGSIVGEVSIGLAVVYDICVLVSHIRYRRHLETFWFITFTIAVIVVLFVWPYFVIPTSWFGSTIGMVAIGLAVIYDICCIFALIVALFFGYTTVLRRMSIGLAE